MRNYSCEILPRRSERFITKLTLLRVFCARDAFHRHNVFIRGAGKDLRHLRVHRIKSSRFKSAAQWRKRPIQMTWFHYATRSSFHRTSRLAEEKNEPQCYHPTKRVRSNRGTVCILVILAHTHAKVELVRFSSQIPRLAITCARDQKPGKRKVYK